MPKNELWSFYFSLSALENVIEGVQILIDATALRQTHTHEDTATQLDELIFIIVTIIIIIQLEWRNINSLQTMLIIYSYTHTRPHATSASHISHLIVH